MGRAWSISAFPRSLLVMALALLANPVLAVTDLDRWFDEELTPWLTETMSTHPRFKGEPIRVTVFDGDDEHPRPDLLSTDLAANLEGALGARSGVKIALRPMPPEFRRGSTATDLHCQPPEESYLIALDATRVRGQQVRVRVRVLDLEERSWVSGISRQWSGVLPRKDSERFDTPAIRDDLRGQRGLPFAADQEDLLAAEIARTVACALLAHPADRPRVWINMQKTDVGDQPAATMVSQYLGRLGLIRHATGESDADLVMTAERHRLGEGLEQVWIGLAPTRPADELPSIRASAYASSKPRDRSRPPLPARPDPPALEEVRFVLLRQRCGQEFCQSPLQPALQVRPGKLERLEVLMVLGDGRLQRLDSERCGTGSVTADGELVRLTLPPSAADERIMIFAIGAQTERAGDALASEVAAVPASCDPMRLRGAPARARLRTLERRLESFPNQIVWRGLATPSPADIRMAGKP